MNEILIFGEIPFEQNFKNSALWVREKLAKMNFTTNKNLLVRINSEGGDVDNGFAIYDSLREISATGVNIITQIDGRCASIATIIFMAGDRRIGNKNFAPFIHSAFGSGEINQHNALQYHNELKNVDDRIANLYATVTKQPKSIFLEMMKNETSINIKKAIELNFFHEIKKITNPKNMSFFKEIKNILNPLFGTKNFKMYTATQELLETETDAPNIMIGDKAMINGEIAKGEIIMENGQTFIFDDAGILLEIKEAIAETPMADEEMQNSIKEVANSIKTLATQFEEFKNSQNESTTEIKESVLEVSNKLKEADKVITSIKNLKADPIDDKKKIEGKSALEKYRK